MSMANAKYRFVWGSYGYPGNNHDSIIFQSSAIWQSIKNSGFFPDFIQEEGDIQIPPIILAGSAFPFEGFLMKPYTNALPTKEQR